MCVSQFPSLYTYNFTVEILEGFIREFLLKLVKTNGFSENLPSYVKGFVFDTSLLSKCHDKNLQR